MYGVRPATSEDVHYILDIDIKCFDDPWPAEHWRLVGDQLNVAVATYYGTPIAMVVFTLAQTETGLPFVTMTKLAVKEPYRNRGIGRTLLRNVEGFGRNADATGIWTTVPESKCKGERNIADWLAKFGFKAVGVNRGCFDAYGYSEDGYLFTRPLCE